jgi:lysophospholipase L1-like esterase
MGRKLLFITGAFALSLGFLALCFSGYLFAVKHYHWPLVRPLARIGAIRSYLLGPAQQRLLEAIVGQDEDRGVFESVMDANYGALLSKRLFRPVTMFEQQKYMYRPGLRKLMFRVGPPGFDHEMETEDTPAVREALRGADANVVTASYDELGFRRPDPSVSAPCDWSVVFLGDSFTDGMWVGDTETFASRYGALARRQSVARVCPVNMGVNGFGSLEEAWVLEQYFEKIPPARAVFLMYFPNDVDADYLGVLKGTVVDLDRKWNDSFTYVRRIAAFTRARGVRLVLAAIPPSEQLRDAATRPRYQDKLRDFAAAEHIQFVDLLSLFERGDHSDLYWTWDPHFTPRGHDVVADLLIKETPWAFSR